MAPHPEEPHPLPGLDERFEEARKSQKARVLSGLGGLESDLVGAVPLDVCLQG